MEVIEHGLIINAQDRNRIVMLNRDWERGQRDGHEQTRNDVTVGLSGMTFVVKLKELPGAPQRVIIESR